MSKCKEPGCNAEIIWAVNLKTLKNVPLVPFDSNYPKAVRYSIRERSDGKIECERNDDGAYMSHFANCSSPSQFNRGNRK